ncbi:acyl-CoA carboxylase subunit epsilon [Streptomyces sp. YC504]|uniref:Acyl-CoA carboxylase subunit epsilon n=1 Tax=Streptomyces mesophilus TaxID=1775132 RepID=A0A6G4XAJ2_9ACTN|nr:acyl-CoA carboxylase epsilon subunit [Streptomyces mesophilus]NGO74172.1 acyl-CoA carboxylase subunit epsilon [Streptomyces mesophilus]
MIKVVRGNPTPEELAAALAVVQARAAAGARPAPEQAAVANAWVRAVRPGVPHRLPVPGPTSWRTSCWPC